MKPPIIILGMHRSGTTLLTNCLKRLGVFIGHRLESHDEAYFFLWRNEYLLFQSGSSWEQPEPLRMLLQYPQIRDDAAAFLRNEVHGPQFIEFLGLSNWLSKKPLDGPWGWKDPRTVFTLPAWKEVFPGAKLLVIHRNGIDVAKSLHQRALAAPHSFRLSPTKRRQQLWWRLVLAARTVPTTGRFSPGIRCMDLDHGFHLWEQYAQEAINQYNGWTSEKMALRYEDFLDSPEETLRQIAEFCEVPATPGQIDEICSQVNRGRAFAFTSSPELIDLYRRVSATPLMTRLGYSDISTGKTVASGQPQ